MGSYGWIGVLVGSTIGGMIPELWGDGMLSALALSWECGSGSRWRIEWLSAVWRLPLIARSME